MAQRLLLDHDSSAAALQSALRSRGWDVVTAAELALEQDSDERLLDYAHGQERTVYTANVRDFVRIHWERTATAASHAGIIVRTEQRMTIGDQLRCLVAVDVFIGTDGFSNRLVYLENYRPG